MSRSDSPAGPPTRWGTTVLWILLVLALAGDAFFIGVSLRHGFPPRPPLPMRGDLSIAPGTYFAQLSPQTRAKVRQAMQARHDVFTKQLAEVLDARNQVIAAMAAEPFDLAAYRKALKHSAEVDAKGREQANDFFASIITEMSPSERKAIADSLNERAANMARRQGWRDRRWSGQWRPNGPPPSGPGGPPQEGPPPGSPFGGAAPAPPSSGGDTGQPANPAP